MTGVLPAFQNLSSKLSTSSQVYTMFVPSDQAFTLMPSHRSQALRDPQLLKSVCIHVNIMKTCPRNIQIFLVVKLLKSFDILICLLIGFGYT